MNVQQNFLSINVSTETLEMTSDSLTNAGKKVKSNIAYELSHQHIKLMISSSDWAKSCVLRRYIYYHLLSHQTSFQVLQQIRSQYVNSEKLTQIAFNNEND